jgi:hypothetical protein
MPMQNMLTVITRITDKDAANQLKEQLLKFDKDSRPQPAPAEDKPQNIYDLFQQMDTIHFARWVVINERGHPHLLFTSCHDGPWEAHIDQLIKVLDWRIEAIWKYCDGFPAAPPAGSDRFNNDFKQYVRKHSFEPDTVFMGYPGVEVTELHSYMRQRAMIEEFLDRPDVQRFVPKFLNDLRARGNNQPRKSTDNRLLDLFKVIVFAIPTFLYSVFVKPIKMRLQGVPRIYYQIPPSDEKMVPVIEDRITQNQMTVITKIKPGILRLLILKGVLALVDSAAKHVFNKGTLNNLSTIHFARWIIIDGDTHLLFESNYDSTWESYIGDFVDRVADGMNLIWSNCVDFPYTKGLTGEGCRDIESFKAYIRRNQIEAQVFYSAYRDRTVRNLLSDIAIGKSLDKAAIMLWLKRFQANTLDVT